MDNEFRVATCLLSPLFDSGNRMGRDMMECAREMGGGAIAS